MNLKINILIVFVFTSFGLSETLAQRRYHFDSEFELNPLTADGIIYSSQEWVNITSLKQIKITEGVTLSGDDARSIILGIGKRPEVSNNTKNWTSNILFDENGEVYAANKRFFNKRGLFTQEQSLLIADGDVLVTHQLYDVFDQPVMKTLPAPIRAEGFNYRLDFITTDGTIYNPNIEVQFSGDGTIQPIDNNEQGSLGWYYSQNNDLEPFVDASDIPYSRKKYYKHKSGEVQLQAGVGEAYQLDGGREVYTRTNSGDLLPDSYEAIYKANLQSTYGPLNIERVNETIVSDVDGRETQVYKDLAGNVLVSKENSTNGELETKYVNIGGSKHYYEFDFSSRGNITRLKIIGEGFFRISNGSNIYYFQGYFQNGVKVIGNMFGDPDKNYLIQSTEPFKVKESYHQGGFMYISPDRFIQSAEVINDKITNSYYIPNNAQNIACIPASGGTNSRYDLYIIDTDEKFSNISMSNLCSYLTPGMEFTLYPENGDFEKDIMITYQVPQGIESYNYYNKSGELICSISPKGVEDYRNGISFNDIDKTTYTYNNRGYLESTSSNEQGTSNYLYAEDGRIRFSENEEQRNQGWFSYTDYDAIGRPIESGQYIGFSDDLNPLEFGSTEMLSTLEDRGLNQWGDHYKSDWMRTYYDLPAADFPLLAELGKQRFTNGNVSWTENEHGKTYYSYDELGRVEWMVQENNFLPEPKKVEYTFDFLGNVLEVAYQAGESDAFYHHYEYDKSKRLKKVYTSLDGNTQNLQATYHYYLHGPLKRVELAEELQGIDYVYNINGQLKAINLPEGGDPGNDGQNQFAEDLFSAYYFYNGIDYKKDNSVHDFMLAKNYDQDQTLDYLYDGNISVSYQENNDQEFNALESRYSYDQRKQLQSADISEGGSSDTYNLSNLAYDYNGNIQSLTRTSFINGVNTTRHDFNYNYVDQTNKLNNVYDTQGSSRWYNYNSIGQMTSQTGAYNQSLEYTASGLVSNINSPSGSVDYTYDDRGFRLRSNSTFGSGTSETVYIRDASGNVLSIYKNNGGTYEQVEVPIYGNDRLGSYQKSESRTVFELKDHLGNVRAVIDRNKDTNGDPIVYQATDYWPFGMVLRSYINGQRYRYGYQGAYAEDETEETGYNSFQLRLYDPIIGRWFAPDPYGQYPSPYVGMGNNPTNGIDPDGGYFCDPCTDGAAIGSRETHNGATYLMEEGGWTRLDGIMPEAIASAGLSESHAAALRAGNRMGIYQAHSDFMNNDVTQGTMFIMGFFTGGSEAYLLGRLGQLAKSAKYYRTFQKFASNVSSRINSHTAKYALNTDLGLNRMKRRVMDAATPSKETYVKAMNKNSITKNVHKRLKEFYHTHYEIVNTKNIEKGFKMRTDVNNLFKLLD